MQSKTMLAAAFALTANTAIAGGLSPEIIEAPAMEDDVVAAAGPSIDPAYIVVGVVAALLIAAAISEGSDDEEETVEATEEPEPEPERTIVRTSSRVNR